MAFWVFMFIMLLLIPATMIGFGKRFKKQGPREINSVYGYRTTRSMRSEEAWEFAHKYFGRLWYIAGIILLPISIIPMLFIIGTSEDTVGNISLIIFYIQIIVMVIMIFPTEKALKNNFDENGRRK